MYIASPPSSSSIFSALQCFVTRLNRPPGSTLCLAQDCCAPRPTNDVDDNHEDDDDDGDNDDVDANDGDYDYASYIALCSTVARLDQ